MQLRAFHDNLITFMKAVPAMSVAVFTAIPGVTGIDPVALAVLGPSIWLAIKWDRAVRLDAREVTTAQLVDRSFIGVFTTVMASTGYMLSTIATYDAGAVFNPLHTISAVWTDIFRGLDATAIFVAIGVLLTPTLGVPVGLTFAFGRHTKTSWHDLQREVETDNQPGRFVSIPPENVTVLPPGNVQAGHSGDLGQIHTAQEGDRRAHRHCPRELEQLRPVGSYRQA